MKYSRHLLGFPSLLCVNRQFAAALADLHEASKLCPNNREICRLLARVEEECKQMQRAQKQLTNPAAPIHDSDQDHGEPEDAGEATERSLGRDVDDEDEASEGWSQNIYSLNRTLPDSNGSVSPPHRQSFRHPHRESVAQKSLLLQPSKQAQIVKTNQHHGSLQVASTRPMNAKTHSQYAPSSPIPSRHISSMLKAGPGIDISPLPDDTGRPLLRESEDHHLVQVHSSKMQELSAAPGAQAQDVRKDYGMGSHASSMRVSSSTSSLASSSSLSDGGRPQGPDVRTKTGSDKPKISQGSSVEYKPRPFMGIMDKKARFQPQQTSHPPISRGWQSQSSEGLVGHTVSSTGVNCELAFAKPPAAFYEQLKTPSQGSALGGQHNGSLHSKEFDKFSCHKDPRPALAVAHSFADSMPKQPGLSRENPNIHVASMKPKRSFIESNV